MLVLFVEKVISYSEIESQVLSPELDKLLTKVFRFRFVFLAQAEPKVRTRIRGAIMRIQRTETSSRTIKRSNQTKGHPF